MAKQSKSLMQSQHKALKDDINKDKIFPESVFQVKT